MDILKTNALSAVQKEAILHLWNKEYPAQLSFPSLQELEHYLRAVTKPQHYIFTHYTLPCAGWAFAFEREGECWFALIVDTALQRTGMGTALLHALKDDYPVLNGWVTDHNNYLKSNGEIYHSPKGFYAKNGFTFCEEQRLETGKLSAVKIQWSRS